LKIGRRLKSPPYIPDVENAQVGTVISGNSNVNLPLNGRNFAQKTIPMGDSYSGNSRRLEFRVEFFNFTNSPIYGGPVANVNSATFGQVLTALGERNIQVGLKFISNKVLFSRLEASK